MSKKYSYSRKIADETFSINDCDSLDEAIFQLGKAVYQVQNDRETKAIKKDIEVRENKDSTANQVSPELNENGGGLVQPLTDEQTLLESNENIILDNDIDNRFSEN